MNPPVKIVKPFIHEHLEKPFIIVAEHRGNPFLALNISTSFHPRPLHHVNRFRSSSVAIFANFSRSCFPISNIRWPKNPPIGIQMGRASCSNCSVGNAQSTFRLSPSVTSSWYLGRVHHKLRGAHRKCAVERVPSFPMRF